MSHGSSSGVQTTSYHGVPISYPASLPKGRLDSFAPLQNWLSSLTSSLGRQQDPSHPFHHDPYKLVSVSVSSYTMFGGQRLGFLNVQADIRNSESWLPGAVFLRGPAVAMLLMLDAPDETYVVLTVQPRPAAGALDFIELPAGMIDDGTFKGAAAEELKEECGIDIQQDRLVDLTEMALGNVLGEAEAGAMYPSVGGCDEKIKIFAYREKVREEQLDDWKGRLTGNRDEGEKITLKLVRMADLWKETTDAKALCAVALWEGLRREGKV